MAITGSTRMQSSTILMYAIGLGIFGYHMLRGISKEEADKTFIDYSTTVVKTFLAWFQGIDESSFLEYFIHKESELYLKKNFIFYETDQ